MPDGTPGQLPGTQPEHASHSPGRALSEEGFAVEAFSGSDGVTNAHVIHGGVYDTAHTQPGAQHQFGTAGFDGVGGSALPIVVGHTNVSENDMGSTRTAGILPLEKPRHSSTDVASCKPGDEHNEIFWGPGK